MRKTVLAIVFAALFCTPLSARPADGEPQPEFRQYVEAQEDAARSRMAFRTAEKDLAALARSSRYDFEQSKEYKQATAEEDRTYSAYLDARKTALLGLKDNPRYAALSALRDDLCRKLEAARLDHRTQESLVPAATLKMRYSADLRRMEEELLRDNKDVSDKREAARAAGVRVVEVRRAYEEGNRRDEKLSQARQAVQDAKLELVASQARLLAVTDAVRAAEDFRYYQHRFDHLKYGRRDIVWGDPD